MGSVNIEASGIKTFSGGNITEERLEEITMPSDNTTSLIVKRFEDYNPIASEDYGQRTNGFGTEAKSPNEEISMEVAQERLMDRIEKDTRFVQSFGVEQGYNFTENETIALTSFIFNLGKGALAQVTEEGSRSKEEIAEKMLLYINAGGKPLEGLRKRREDEYRIFTGETRLS